MEKDEKKDKEEVKEKTENEEVLSNEKVVSEDNNDEADCYIDVDNLTSPNGTHDESEWNKAGSDSDDIEIDNSDTDNDSDSDNIDTNTLLKILMQVHNIKNKKGQKGKKRISSLCQKISKCKYQQKK